MSSIVSHMNIMKAVAINSNLNTVEDRSCDLDKFRPEILQKIVFNNLRKNGWREVPWKRYVVLSFDIVSCKYLNPNLTSKQLEQLPYFTLLFAIQIINTNKFQPVGKVFCKRNVSPETVAMCIQSFIRDLMRCEYSVIATVCKPITLFRKTIQILIKDSLKNETDAHIYHVEHLEIIHFYDPVTLLEHTLLLFLKYVISYKNKGKNLYATYDDCKAVLLVSANKHVINDVFNHTNNMRCAIRLFSTTFYREMKNCIKDGHFRDTGTKDFMSLFDTLFDSLHGQIKHSTKLARHPITTTSCHFELWNKLSPVLETMHAKYVLGKKTCEDENNKIHGYGKTQLASDAEYFEILNMICQGEVPLDTRNTRLKLPERIRDLKVEQENMLLKREEPENLDSIEIETQNNNLAEYVAEVAEENKQVGGDFDDSDDCCATIETLNIELVNGTQDSQVEDCQAVEIVDDKAATLENYSKKLYLILQESECSDIRMFDDYGYAAIENNVAQYIDIPADSVEVIDELTLSSLRSKEFAIRHFHTGFDYLENFINEMDTCKKTNCIKIVLENDNVKETETHEECEITQDNKTVLEEDEPMEVCTNSSDGDEEAANIDFPSSDGHLQKSSFNVTTVERIFDTFNYIDDHLQSSADFSELLRDITDYLRKLNICGMKFQIHTDKFSEQTDAIYRFLIKMLTMLTINRATIVEQEDAYKKVTHIKLQLMHLLKNAKLQKQEKESVHRIPSFFKSMGLKGSDTKDCNQHGDLNKIHEKVPNSNGEKIIESKANSNQKSDSASNVNSKGETKSDNKNYFRPFILDAWQININGARKLFEFLHKRRFLTLNMNSLNIDRIRQICNTIRADHGVIDRCNYYIDMNFINPIITPDVFETHGTIILE